MNTTRRVLLGSASAAILARRSRAADRPVVKIGVINDQSGVYRDVNGPTSVACTRQAIEEFAPAPSTSRCWWRSSEQARPGRVDHQTMDRSGGCRFHPGRRILCGGAGDFVDLRGEEQGFRGDEHRDIGPDRQSLHAQHYPLGLRYLMEARSTGGAMVKAGGDTWFFITPNYAAGLAFQRDTTAFVEKAGGKILGAHLYPFPETSDFSAPLIEGRPRARKYSAFPARATIS